MFAVDHEFNAHVPKVSTISLDLQREPHQQITLSMIATVKPAAIHLGLPCGTCSRARDKALPVSLRSSFRAPPPLRDAQNLLGFSYLTGVDADKVAAANKLYQFAVEVLRLCYSHNLQVSIENPERSWLWGVLTLFVLRDPDLNFVEWFRNLEKVSFHSCMHGGTRAKHTRLLASAGLYSQLAMSCDNSHPHEAWNIAKTPDGLRFDTALEAEYPSKLCQRMADLLAAKLHLPVVPPPLAPHATARRALGTHVKRARRWFRNFAKSCISTLCHQTTVARRLHLNTRGNSPRCTSSQTQWIQIWRARTPQKGQRRCIRWVCNTHHNSSSS